MISQELLFHYCRNLIYPIHSSAAGKPEGLHTNGDSRRLSSSFTEYDRAMVGFLRYVSLRRNSSGTGAGVGCYGEGFCDSEEAK